MPISGIPWGLLLSVLQILALVMFLTVYFIIFCLLKTQNNITLCFFFRTVIYTWQQQYNSFWVSGPDSSVCVCGKGSSHTHHHTILKHQQGVRELNSILTLSAWRWRQIPQVKGLCPARLLSNNPTPDTSRKLQAVTCVSNQLATDERFQ